MKGNGKTLQNILLKEEKLMKKIVLPLLLLLISITACGVKTSDNQANNQGNSQTNNQTNNQKPEHKHDYKETIIEATCGKNGSKTYTCTICQDTYSDVIPALQHSYQISKTINATCTSKGSKTYTCSNCKQSYSEDIPALVHAYAVTKTVNSTCTSNGSKTYTCSLCSKSYTESIVKTNHSWSSATCTLSKKCNVCGTTEGSALGHNYSSGVCTRCGIKVSFSMEYVMAAYALRDAYNAAKFPETLYIQKAYYTTDNGAGNPVVVLFVASQNSFGGYSIAYSRAMKDPNPNSNDYNYNNLYYIDVKVSNSNPYLSYANYTQIDVQTCYDAYNALF